jgi:hypothetical protein
MAGDLIGSGFDKEMKLPSQRVVRGISFLVGPLMGGLLIAWAAWAGVGPGLATLCILGAFVLIVLAPIIQFFLLKTPMFRGRHLAAALTVIVTTCGILIVAALSGVFNYW